MLTDEGKDWIKGDFNVNLLNKVVNNALNDHDFKSILFKVVAQICSDHYKGIYQTVNLKKLTYKAWINQVKSVLKQEWQWFSKYMLQVVVDFIEISFKAKDVSSFFSKQLITDFFSPSASSAFKRTQITQQMKQQRSEHHIEKVCDDFTLQLIDKWVCKSD